MGVCIAPAFDKDILEAEFDGDGKALANTLHHLDKIAKAKGIAPLSDFFSGEELECEYETDAQPPGDIPPDTWYDPRTALRTVDVLIAALEDPNGKARRLINGEGGILSALWRAMGIRSGMEGKWGEAAYEDLKELRRCLQIAAEQGAKFYLFVW